MKGPLIQLYPFLVLWIFLNVFTLNIISSPFPRNDILCCDWSLFTLLTVRCRMLYLPFLMCIFMGMWCVCMSEYACCSLKLISNVFLDHSLPPLLRQGLPQNLKPTSSDNFRKPACTGDALSLCLYRAGSQEAIISAWHFLGLWGSKFWSPHTCTGSASSTEPSPRPQTGPI